METIPKNTDVKFKIKDESTSKGLRMVSQSKKELSSSGNILLNWLRDDLCTSKQNTQR